MIRVGDAASRHFSMRGSEYRITLQDIRPLPGYGGRWRSYHFLIQEEEAGTAKRRAEARTALIRDHDAAVRSNDDEGLRRTVDSILDSVFAELSPSLDHLRLAAVTLNHSGRASRRLGDRSSERAAFSRIIDELDIPDGVIQRERARALFDRAETYRDGKESYDPMLNDLAEIDRRYASLPQLDAMELVAAALVMKAHAFYALGRLDEMRQAAQTVNDRYSSHDEPEIAKQVMHAREVLQFKTPGVTNEERS